MVKSNEKFIVVYWDKLILILTTAVVSGSILAYVMKMSFNIVKPACAGLQTLVLEWTRWWRIQIGIALTVDGSNNHLYKPSSDMG